MTSVFSYGSLALAEVWTLVAGRLHPSEPALLAGYRRRLLHGAPYPGIVTAPAEEVEGVLWHGVEPEVLARLDGFEGDLYERIAVEVQAGEHRIEAEAYVIRAANRARLSPEPWSEARFRERELERYLAGCRRFAATWGRGTRPHGNG